MERAVDPEFLAIARDTANNPWDQSEGAAHETDDWFQTDSYEGGFEATEQQLTPDVARASARHERITEELRWRWSFCSEA